jgi:hypothetical protein
MVDTGYTWNLYINDNNTLSSPFTKSIPDNNVTFTPSFGYRVNNDTNYFGGEMGHVRFYDKELSSTELSNLFSTGSING